MGSGNGKKTSELYTIAKRETEEPSLCTYPKLQAGDEAQSSWCQPFCFCRHTRENQTALESTAAKQTLFAFKLLFCLCYKITMAQLCQFPCEACSRWNRSFQYPQEHSIKVSIYIIYQIWSVSAVKALSNTSLAPYIIKTRLRDDHYLKDSWVSTSP